MKLGKVYLVGAGPGDPGLLTVKGLELLRRADAVYYDRLVSPRLLQHCRPDAKLVYVGKEPEGSSRLQGGINAQLIRAARAGKMVVRLKGGDPFIFGRGGEELLALAKRKIPFEVVPGVTSAIAAPAYAGIPLTERSRASSVAIITGHEDPDKPGSALRWKELATACDTLVALMGVATLPGIVRQLRRYGRAASTPCAVIERGTTPRQRTVTGTLATIVRRVTQAAIRPPAVLVVGEVVSLRRRLQWLETKPLHRTRILVTRAAEKAAAFADQLEALGAEVIQLPAIELAPVKANGAFREVVSQLPRTDWVFFTSPEGIGWFSKMLRPYRKDVRCLSGCHIGAIGPKTAVAVESHGLHVDFVPRRFNQEGLVAGLPNRLLRGKRALILSAAESRDALESGLRRRGMQVNQVPIYQTIIPKAFAARAAAAVQAPCDFVTVTSASCVDHLAQALEATGRRALFRRLPFASIGPVTSQAVRARGGRVAVEAKTSTVEGLIEAMVRARR